MSNISIDYAKKLKIRKKFSLKYIYCEICSNKNNEVFVNSISIGANRYSKLNYDICRNCGHLFLNPIMEKSFYDFYYNEFYKNVANRGNEPSKIFIKDQILRGKKLLKFLKDDLKKKKKLKV